MSEHFMPFAMLGVRFVRAWFGVDGNVVHIDREPTLGNFPMEYCVHHHLESSWRVGEAEEHNCWFKESLWGEEGSFPLVSIFDVNIVVSPADIKLSEQGASTEAVNSLGNKGGDVLIFLGPFVDWPIILY